MAGVRVLLVGDAGSVHIRRLASSLAKAGLRVEVATFGGEPILGGRLYRLGGRGGPKLLRLLLAVPRLWRIVRHSRPHIVHAHYTSSFGLVSAIALRFIARSRRPSLIQTAWGTDLLLTARASVVRRALARFALRQAVVITGDSQDLLEEASSLARTVAVHRFVFGPPAELLSGERTPENLIVSTRRLDPDTRVELVVSAFLLARRRQPDRMRDWRLIVAGDGDATESVRRAASGSKCVEFVGQLEPSALYELLCRAHALVSVPMSDATSASLLEALAAGIVLVVNDLPANREWVNASTAEIVSRNPSVAELADAIERAVARPILRSSPRDQVRGVTWEVQVTELVALYARLLRDSQGLA